MRAAFVLCAALLAGPSHAFFKDGNKLLSELNNNPGTSLLPAVGIGYIVGVTDALYGITHCPPENVTAGQIRDMVKNYLENTPAIRHLPANQIIVAVLRGVWPCAEKPAGRQL